MPIKVKPKPLKSIIAPDANLAQSLRAAFDAGIENVSLFTGTGGKLLLTYSHSGGRSLRIENGTDPADMLLQAFGNHAALIQRIGENRHAFSEELVAMGAKRKRLGTKK